MAQLAEIEDPTLLRRRARRRLVGAIALVVLVVIVLPIVLDREPSPVGRDLTVEIPSLEAGKFTSRVHPPSALGEPTRGSTERAGSAPAPARTEQPAAARIAPPAAQTATKGTSSAAKKQAPPTKQGSEAARAMALLESKDTWVVRLGAYSNRANVKQLRDKLTAAGVKSFTEAATGSKGEPTTRVRAGPFDSKGEAERAQMKLMAAGIAPGTVGPR